MKTTMFVTLALLGACGTGVIDEGEDYGDERELAAVGATGCYKGDYKPFRGDLHNHTSYSDGDGKPADAFRFARDQSGLDFLAVTDHRPKMTDETYAACRAQASKVNAVGRFVAFCGYEVGVGASTDSHANVLFAPGRGEQQPVTLADLFATVGACAECVGQFNHPSNPDSLWTDYTYSAEGGAKMKLFEFNSKADWSAKWAAYIAALEAGWRVGPAWNGDTHSARWGSTGERTVLFAKKLSRGDLRKAMLARRSCASDDGNAALVLKANGCWMGSTLAARTKVTITVEASDPQGGDGFRHVTLHGKGGGERIKIDCNGQSVCTAKKTIKLAPPTYVIAVAVQADGDHVVSAPIWFGE